MEPESPAPAPSSSAAERTNLPGIFLLIVGILNVLGAGYFILSGINGMSQAKQVENAPLTPEQKKAKEDLEKMGWSMEKAVRSFSGGFIAAGVIGLLCAALTIVGGIKMRSLQSRGLALTGAIVAMIPCISATGCCGVGEGIGIWALVVLMNAEVKAAFR
jgi:hypothetical protein